jgi:hypothetical protein
MTVISKTWYHSRRLNCIIAMYTYIPVKLSTGNYTNIVMMYICQIRPNMMNRTSFRAKAVLLNMTVAKPGKNVPHT